MAALEPKFVTMEQFRIFRDEGLAKHQNGLRDTAFASLLLTTGMRLSEANDFRVDQVCIPDRFYKHTVNSNVAKGGKSRHVYVPKNNMNLLMQYKDLVRPNHLQVGFSTKRITKDSGFFWLNKFGQHMEINGWEDSFQRASKKSGIKVTPHMLRHSFAVYMLSNLIKKTVQQAVGHADLEKETKKLQRGSVEQVYQSILGDPLRRLQKLMGHSRYETTFIYLETLSSHDNIAENALSVFGDILSSEAQYGK